MVLNINGVAWRLVDNGAWYQAFRLSDGVASPLTNDMRYLLSYLNG